MSPSPTNSSGCRALPDLTLADVERLSINAMKSAFVGYDERVAIIYARIKAWLRASSRRASARRISTAADCLTLRR